MLPSGLHIHIGPPSTGPSSRSFSVLRYGRELVEVRVHVGAVVALAVVVEEELPVRRRPRRPSGAPRRSSGSAPVLELALQRRQRLGEGHRVGGEVDEEEALPLGERHRVQRVVGAVEAGDVLHVGRRAQRAVEAVGPGVVRALDGGAEGCRRARRKAACRGGGSGCGRRAPVAVARRAATSTLSRPTS